MAKRKAKQKDGDDDKGDNAELLYNEDTGEFKMERTSMRQRQERLRCGDTDATIWEGLNGVGLEVIKE